MKRQVEKFNLAEKWCLEDYLYTFLLGFGMVLVTFQRRFCQISGGGEWELVKQDPANPKACLNCQVERMLWQHCWHEVWKLFNSNFRFGAFRCWIFCFKEMRRVQRSHSLPSNTHHYRFHSLPARSEGVNGWSSKKTPRVYRLKPVNLLMLSFAKRIFCKFYCLKCLKS